MATKIAKDAYRVVNKKGESVFIAKGEIHDSKHAKVKEFPWAFADPEDLVEPAPYVRTAEGVEQATAAPGEKRKVSTRKKP